MDEFRKNLLAVEFLTKTVHRAIDGWEDSELAQNLSEKERKLVGETVRKLGTAMNETAVSIAKESVD